MISNIYHIFEYTIFWKLFVDDTYKLFKSYLKKKQASDLHTYIPWGHAGYWWDWMFSHIYISWKKKML